MSDTPNYITIRNAVASFFVRSELDVRFWEKMSAIACEAIAELNIFHTKTIRSVFLDINSINMVNLPIDYVDYIRPPSLILGNRISQLTEDNTIPLNQEIDCGMPTNPQQTNVPLGRFYPYYIDHTGRVQYGHHPATNIAYYRIDKVNRLIRLRGNIPTDKLYLEYVSTGLSIDSDTIIPRETLPTLRAYLLWQSVENDPRVGRNEKDSKKKQYEEALLGLHHFIQSFSLQELIDILKSTYSQSVKR